ncbi:YqgE/AlgH family protein [Aestuariibius sp. 2305UL40-4]|uniref:YqgE/AlgH family protein n=1 Tax=Aestuariibius violaceus TaxID=3234132 RepID=UPI00345F0244
MSEPTDLTGHLLIAMPALADPRFARSVIYLCAHSDSGALGLIINKPSDEVSFRDVLEATKIEDRGGTVPIHFGGPVEMARGFVLHSCDYSDEGATLHEGGPLAMTSSTGILTAISGQSGPAKALLALGYAGWAPGQLEAEIARNDWLTCEASPRLVFDLPNDEKWQAALETLGISALTLSSDAGRA